MAIITGQDLVPLLPDETNDRRNALASLADELIQAEVHTDIPNDPPAKVKLTAKRVAVRLASAAAGIPVVQMSLGDYSETTRPTPLHEALKLTDDERNALVGYVHGTNYDVSTMVEEVIDADSIDSFDTAVSFQDT